MNIHGTPDPEPECPGCNEMEMKVQELEERIVELREKYEPVPHPDERWWGCIIGPMEPQHLTGGKDSPMRNAVAEAFKSICSEDPEHCFSGWNANPTEPERAVIEDRLPRLYQLAETEKSI